MKKPDSDVDELTDDAVTADFRLLQRRRGHRFSLDDVVTAHEAASQGAPGGSYADLGCGVASVLLMVAWKLRPARILGVEAQPESHALAVRNVERAGLSTRTELRLGDLRTPATDTFDLVTGTPPYLPLGTALASPDPQRAACRLELRGGVEDYIDAGARALGSGGLLVLCADGRRPERVTNAAARAGLTPSRRLDVFARADAPGPLFAVWTLRRGTREVETRRLDVRDGSGKQTPGAAELRRFFGLGP